MPSQWEVALAGPSGTGVPLTAPHAVLSRWLDDPPPAHGTRAVSTERSGHTDQVKKWACGPLRAGNPGGGLALDIRLLDDSLSDRLQTATRPGAAVRLGSGHFQVCAPPRMLASSTWQDLRSWPGTRAWQLRFVTPACARRNNRASPLLSPEALARGLADRWRGLDPGSAPAVAWRGTGSVWVSDIDGHSEAQVLARRPVQPGQRDRREEIISGFTGRIRYVCDQGSPADAACFHALLAFAAFAGAGAHTAYGFGVVVAEPTWQPPTVSAGAR